MERATELQGEGNAALRGGDARAACELYTRALALCPASHALWSNRSAARLLLGDAAGAASDARECARLCPASSAASAKASHRLSRALAAAGDLHAAAAAALRCCAAARGSALEPQALDLLADAHCALADDLARLGDPRGAARALSVAVDECPARWVLWTRRSEALQGLGELADALSDAMRGADLCAGLRQPEAASRALLRVARVEEALRWFDSAAVLYERCLQLARWGPPSARPPGHLCPPASCWPPPGEDPVRIPSVRMDLPLRTTCGRPDREPARVIAALGPALERWPVALRESPRGGVGVFATKRVRAGQTLYTERVVVCAVRDRARCYHCLAALPRRPWPCRGSCGRLYCSPECEKEAHGAYHSPLCGKRLEVLEALVDRSTTASGLSPLVMWKVVGAALLSALPRMPGSALPAAPADVPPFSHLCRCTDHAAGAPRPHLVLQAHGMIAMFEGITAALGRPLSLDPGITFSTMMDLRAAVDNNAIALRPNRPGARMADVGVALMTTGSMFNHSCEPSAAWEGSLDTGNTLRFVAARDIAAGEEVTISYVDQSAEWVLRQRALVGQYGFLCRCPKCVRQSGAASPEQRKEVEGFLADRFVQSSATS
eukprot:m51a1_g9565 hypothetical protein (609) ;mRNA; r:910920-912829